MHIYASYMLYMYTLYARVSAYVFMLTYILLTCCFMCVCVRFLSLSQVFACAYKRMHTTFTVSSSIHLQVDLAVFARAALRGSRNL